MKFVSKRILSWLLSLAMLASLLSGMSLLPAQAATVDYVYSGNYVYNWGEREELATFLSPMAEDWYEKNNTSYEELSSLSGASSVGSVPSSALYRELQELMKSNHTYTTSYEATKELFRYTDCQNSGGAISSFYSGRSIGPSWDGTWNREHTWPNSKGDASGQGENDIIMLRPTSTTENSSRGNTAYGEGSSYYHPNSESGGKYDLRGDVARIMLFVYCRWGNTGMMWGSSGVIESKDVLLKWIEEDPVDTWELGRNDAAESITGTRNVFVDYPELIFVLFDEDVPEDYDTPSGIGPGVTYTVTASSNNTAYGTVSVSGRTITATPKSGYMVSGYEIVGGDRNAIVTREGNAFKVSASSDVSIRILFAPRSKVNVQFYQQGAVAKTQTVYSGDSITLPAYTGTVPTGYTFVGWVKTIVEDTIEKPSCYTVGSSYTVSSAIAFYALFSRFEGEGVSNSDVYELVTDKSDLQIGDKVIIYAVGKGVALGTEQKSNNRGETAVAVDGNSITRADGVQVITLEAGKTAGTYAFNVGNGYLYAASSSANYLRTETTLSNNGSWSISISSTGSATIKANGSFTRNWLRYNNGAKLFSCYTSGQDDIALYKQQAGTVYYFTGAACEHNYAAATCTEPKTCTLCGVQVGEALGHTYDHDCDTACNRCGAVRTTQHTYDNACDATCNACGDTRTPASHVYDNACDAACNVCGASRTVADHVYDNACDATCNVCGATRTPAAHTYTADCDTICDVCGAERSVGVGGEVSITFDDTSKRTQFTTSIQVWEENDITVTNTKTSSSSAVTDYADPARFYKNSKLTVDYPGMVKIVFHCSSDGYATDLQKSLGIGSVSDKTVTIELDNVNTFTVTLSGGQVRMHSITVTAAGAEHTYSAACDTTCNACGTVREAAEHAYTATETSATCGTDGVRTYTCAQCGDSYTEAIPATGQHTYDDEYDADCNVCGDKREVPEKPADVLYGDADGDGDITVGDVVILQQFLAEWGGIEIDMVAADADGDGDVTVGDVVILQQFLAEWDVTLGP